jgi:hypothetical protein
MYLELVPMLMIGPSRKDTRRWHCKLLLLETRCPLACKKRVATGALRFKSVNAYVLDNVPCVAELLAAMALQHMQSAVQEVLVACIWVSLYLACSHATCN